MHKININELIKIANTDKWIVFDCNTLSAHAYGWGKSIYIYALRHSVSLDHYVSGDQEKKRKIEYRQKEVMYSIMQ